MYITNTEFGLGNRFPLFQCFGIAQLGFKEFESARRTLVGIEIVHILRKNQMIGQDETMFDSFRSLAS